MKQLLVLLTIACVSPIYGQLLKSDYESSYWEKTQIEICSMFAEIQHHTFIKAYSIKKVKMYKIKDSLSNTFETLLYKSDTLLLPTKTWEYSRNGQLLFENECFLYKITDNEIDYGKYESMYLKEYIYSDNGKLERVEKKNRGHVNISSDPSLCSCTPLKIIYEYDESDVLTSIIKQCKDLELECIITFKTDENCLLTKVSYTENSHSAISEYFVYEYFTNSKSENKPLQD